MRTFIATYHPHYKELIYIGIPIVIGQIGIVLVGLADNIMVGRYDTLHLAAASFVNSAFNIPILFGLGFSYGLTPLVGQCFGRRDKFRIGQLLKHSLIANGLTGVLLTLVMTVLYFNIDRLGQPQELLPLIRPYYLLQLASLVFVMLFNAFKQFADGITDTRTPMYIMISTNVLNIIGNYILIYGKLGIPPLGVTGAGISTLVSRILMLAAFIVIFCRSRHYRRYFTGYKRSQSNRKDFFTLNRMGWMIGVQMGLETALFSITGWLAGKHSPGKPPGYGCHLHLGIHGLLRHRRRRIRSREQLLRARRPPQCPPHHGGRLSPHPLPCRGGILYFLLFQGYHRLAVHQFAGSH